MQTRIVVKTETFAHLFAGYFISCVGSHVLDEVRFNWTSRNIIEVIVESEKEPTFRRLSWLSRQQTQLKCLSACCTIIFPYSTNQILSYCRCRCLNSCCCAKSKRHKHASRYKTHEDHSNYFPSSANDKS